MKKIDVKDLRIGDLVWVKWYDASEIRGEIPNQDKLYDSVVFVVGIFLGFKGRKRKHLILGKEKLPNARHWNADFIPVELVDEILLEKRGFLQKVWPGVIKELKKFSFVVVKNAYSRRLKVDIDA